MRPLSKSTSERGRGTAPRASPPRAKCGSEAFGRVVPAFSRANAGWRIGPECAPPRRGQPRGASSTRAQHPAARAGGLVPARDNPAHPSARAGSVDNPPGSFTQTLASAARFSISPGSRRSTCSTFLSAFFPTAFFLFFCRSRVLERRLPRRPLLFSRAFVSAARTRAAAATGRARPRRLCSRTWLSRALRASRPEFDPRARRRAPRPTRARAFRRRRPATRARRRRKP